MPRSRKFGKFGVGIRKFGKVGIENLGKVGVVYFTSDLRNPAGNSPDLNLIENQWVII